MRIRHCNLENFASYGFLNFNFENKGLTLIQGATGSGKSTLCDAIPWVLFGTTAKNGAVDEVLAWNATGPTVGSVCLDLNGNFLVIRRVRGGKNNDLCFFTSEAGEAIRGKDMVDTQKLINAKLGIDSALYLSGAYFHEFAQTAQFFITTAKNRRAICEQLVDLSLAKNLQADLSEQKKALTKTQASYASKVQLYTDRVQMLSRDNGYGAKAKTFEVDKAAKVQAAEKNAKAVKAKIKPAEYFTQAAVDISEAEKTIGDETCSKCGSKTHSEDHETIAKLKMELRAERTQNTMYIQTYTNLVAQIGEEKSRENTYNLLLTQQLSDLAEAETALEGWKSEFEDASHDLADIELLGEVVTDFRGALIKNTIQDIENQTNTLLSNHFDAEIKVSFEVADADKLDVTIYKDGNNCVYSQLSKGQRQLLKLCFGVSVMRTVANHHGTAFNAVFFDEALDGLDDVFKVKAFNLLKTIALEYESVFIVEHSAALKALFERSFEVELIGGNSVIAES